SNDTAAKANALKEVTRQAEAEHTARENEFKIFGPIWDQAATLDSRITSATTELETSRSQAKALEQEAEQARIALQALQQEDSKARETLQATEAELAERSSDCALADNWLQIRQHIVAHDEARSALTRARSDSD